MAEQSLNDDWLLGRVPPKASADEYQDEYFFHVMTRFCRHAFLFHSRPYGETMDGIETKNARDLHSYLRHRFRPFS
jgi:hypothetical protein